MLAARRSCISRRVRGKHAASHASTRRKPHVHHQHACLFTSCMNMDPSFVMGINTCRRSEASCWICRAGRLSNYQYLYLQTKVFPCCWVEALSVPAGGGGDVYSLTSNSMKFLCCYVSDLYVTVVIYIIFIVIVMTHSLTAMNL